MKIQLARAAGILVQGIILGTLLFLALLKLSVLQSGGRIFYYQGF